MINILVSLVFVFEQCQPILGFDSAIAYVSLWSRNYQDVRLWLTRHSAIA
jgi:hypothetical protein